MKKLSFLLFFCLLALTPSAFAVETCDEGCTTATESGISFFTRDNSEQLKCCCIESETTQQMESKPVNECPED